ncbi:UDP-glucose 4-epimerase [Serratia rubidaea]|uniref:UDP-glucose 4-epimerase n=1 Tax=Serratia rubidaea TaxID=61652 RepID=A0A4U9HEJ9_SERRU|nr:UDP-glucose 4-epimerase [Serratia rubidaea]
MKKVAIVGLGWLGMPLALSLISRGFEVVGSKTTPDGVEAARMSGVECYPLTLTPELECEADDLDALLQVDALVITLPARRTVEGSENYFNAVRMLVDSAMAYGVSRIIFTSSTSVYGEAAGMLNEDTPINPVSPSGRCWRSWSAGCMSCPIPRWIFYAWPGWWAPSVIRGVFWPVRWRSKAAGRASICCIRMTRSPRFNCC